jgi:hypothetical protein
MYLVLALLAAAPVIRVDRVVPWNYDRPAPMKPGVLFIIYGENLGPETGCVGTPKIVQRLNAPSVAVYPPELCGTQVLVGDKPAGLLWTQAGQINIQVPEGVPLESTAPLRVVYQSASSAELPVRVSALTAELIVDQAATTKSPVWVKVGGPPGSFPEVRYPFPFGPAHFGCAVFEVRRNGVPLPRIPVRDFVGFAGSGPICGSIALPAPEPTRNRIPLHLAYRFDQPGLYEVRYSYRPALVDGSPTTAYSEWTRLEVRQGTDKQRRQWLQALPVPGSPGLVLTDYLPSILGLPDDTSLRLLVPLLYHADSLVRDFALRGFGFWSEAEATAAARQALRQRGPCEGVVRLLGEKVEAAELLPYMKSSDPAVMLGVLYGFQALYRTGQAGAAEDAAVIAAQDHFLRSTDEQTRGNYVALLGSVKDPRAGKLLWQVKEAGGTAAEQAFIAITWRKDPADLPKLGLRMSNSSEPYALHNGYGEASLPYLETALVQHPQIFVRGACARELIVAGRPSGFTYVLEAIEQNTGVKGEMVQFLKDRFPELRQMDEAAIVTWLRQRTK